jgi:pyruvate dehydrogenase E1 component alpha subunit
VAAGVCAHLRDGDAVYSGHRADGHALAMGAPPDRVLAELMGRADGLCEGMGGSMHLVDVAHGFLGATGIVGGTIPLALGGALAHRMAGRDAVAVVFFGDGAVQAGHFAESVNLATLWRLPVLLVCENNGFAEFTPRSAHTNVDRVADVVAPYALPSVTVDGDDAVAVWSAAGRLLGAARTGAGPALLECLTHRLRGHYEGDPDTYREAASKEERQRTDPVLRMRRRGTDAGWFTEEDADATERAAAEEIAEAVRFAHASPFPPPGLPASLVYAGDESR